MKNFTPIEKNNSPGENKIINFSNTQILRNAVQRMEDAKNQPEIKRLVSDIWQTNELHILFGDNASGKSILAVSIADALSKGKKFLFLENDNQPLKILYYDFELSDRQFRKRYSDNFDNGYDFSQNFIIDNLDFSELLKQNTNKKFEEILFEKIIADVTASNTNVLIIDNLTYLNMQTTQETAVAMQVMRQLTDLKRDKNLSIMVIAHTPKIDLYSPLTINSLAGSKHISNFADSVSCIGKSQSDPNLRYIKQVKPSRSGELIYDTNNVITCKLAKNGNFLTLDFLQFDSELLHLKQRKGLSNEQKQQIVELNAQGKSYREIAEELNISKSVVGKILNRKEKPK